MAGILRTSHFLKRSVTLQGALSVSRKGLSSVNATCTLRYLSQSTPPPSSTSSSSSSTSSDPFHSTADYSFRHLTPSNLTVSDLLQAQLHLGHQASRWNPQMLPYIFGKRHNLYIINLEQTLSAIRRACNFVRSVAYHDGIILFAAKNPYLHSIATSSALESQQYYIHNWTAGTLTNTSEIVAKNGETEIHKPDVLILLDAKDNMKAVKEARKVNVPTIALVDTDMDPRWISFPIPGNDEGVKGIELVSRVLSVAAREGVEKRLAEKKRS